MKQLINLVNFLEKDERILKLERILEVITYTQMKGINNTYIQNRLINFFDKEYNIYNTFIDVMYDNRLLEADKGEFANNQTLLKLIKLSEIYSIEFCQLNERLNKPFHVGMSTMRYDSESELTNLSLTRNDLEEFNVLFKKENLLEFSNSLINVLTKVIKSDHSNNKALPEKQVNSFFNNVKELMVTIKQQKDT